MKVFIFMLVMCIAASPAQAKKKSRGQSKALTYAGPTQVGLVINLPKGWPAAPVHSFTNKEGFVTSKAWVPKGQTATDATQLLTFVTTGKANGMNFDKMASMAEDQVGKSGCRVVSKREASAPVLRKDFKPAGRKSEERYLRYLCDNNSRRAVSRLVDGDKTNLFVVTYETHSNIPNAPSMEELEKHLDSIKIVENGMRDINFIK